MRNPVLASVPAFVLASLALGLLGIGGCATAPPRQADRAALLSAAGVALDRFAAVEPDFHRSYERLSTGKAVFPSIGKGGYFVGGAFGQGVVFEGDRAVGFCRIQQATVGLQLGGQSFSQIIYFNTAQALETFKSSQITSAAQASAVAVRADASTQANPTDGVAIFTFDGTGLMYEAAFGAQKFSFQPDPTLGTALE